MSDISQVIRNELAGKKIISFARFMELALYCPGLGYYERAGVAPGRTGDFFTSVSVGGLFGELLAAQFAEWIDAMPDGSRQLVEAGAHHGQLAEDILRWLKTFRPELLTSLEYWILEPSTKRREIQQEKLAEFAGKVRWFDSWNALPAPVNGVIFSNELLDAMPVHRLGWDAKNNQWIEWGVELRGNDFAWARMDNLDVCPTKTPIPGLPDGFLTEISPAAVEWWQGAARALRSGRLMTLDYGLAAEEFFAPQRSEGTLRTYHHHRAGKDLLAQPGEQDITAQVNFTVIIEAGASAGLKTSAWLSQEQFLNGVLRRNVAHPWLKQWTPAQIRQFQTLTHPEHLGSKFRVLVQERNPPS